MVSCRVLGCLVSDLLLFFPLSWITLSFILLPLKLFCFYSFSIFLFFFNFPSIRNRECFPERFNRKFLRERKRARRVWFDILAGWFDFNITAYFHKLLTAMLRHGDAYGSNINYLEAILVTLERIEHHMFHLVEKGALGYVDCSYEKLAQLIAPDQIKHVPGDHKVQQPFYHTSLFCVC